MSQLLEQALSWLMRIQPDEVKQFVHGLRRNYPKLGNRELARKVTGRTAWKGTASGMATGLPPTLAVALPAAAVDLTYLFRIEIVMAARVATIYDEHFLDDPDAVWQLFVPILGANAASEFLRDLGIAAGQQLTKAAVRKFISKDALRALQKFVLKVFGKRVTQRAIITKSVPVVGAVIGGAWNHVEVRIVGGRVVAYCEGEGLQPAPVQS